jgi:hypothetical protein
MVIAEPHFGIGQDAGNKSSRRRSCCRGGCACAGVALMKRSRCRGVSRSRRRVRVPSRRGRNVLALTWRSTASCGRSGVDRPVRAGRGNRRPEPSARAAR